MASVAFSKNGTARVQFKGPDGLRKTVRLGHVSKRDAEAVRLRIEDLVSNRIVGTAPEHGVSAWLAALPDRMYARLARVGLVEPREDTRATVGDLLRRFVETKTVKPGTLAAYQQAIGSLRKHLGEGTPLARLTPAHADEWRKAISDEGLAPATIAKRVHIARQIFKRAVRWGLIPESPFADLRAGSQSNPDRNFYVSRETIATIIAAAPNTRWRAIIALCRYAGLRSPSEIGRLRWCDVNWERGRLTVRSPKTAGYEGHAVRVVPIAPELRPHLLALFEDTEPGVVEVVPRLDSAVNLRTTFQKIIARAGEKPWPRLFQSLRASCATDWCETFPGHVVAGWLGHSPVIAARHYLQTRDAHFDLAAGVGEAAQNAAQQPSDAHRNRPQTRTPTPVFQAVAAGCGPSQSDTECLMGAGGFEPPKA
jgi:integrase